METVKQANQGHGVLRPKVRVWLLAALLLLTILNVALFYARQRENHVAEKPPQYHFYMILQNSVDPFWQDVRRGAQDAAKALNVAIEFRAPQFNNSEEEQKYIDIATLSRVDGIITPAVNNPDFIKLINQATAQGIPVITIENDAKDSQRQAFIGSNSFMLGAEAGKLLNDAVQGKARVAVIMSSELEKDALTQNMIMNGFSSTLKDTPGIEVVKVYTPKMEILSTEEITQAVLRQGDINAVVCLDAINTVGVAQSIVDFNRVGKITVIGYGITPEIKNYIEKGVIYGTVVGNPYTIGYNGVKSMLEVKQNRTTSSVTDTGVQIVDKADMKSYEMQNSGGKP